MSSPVVPVYCRRRKPSKAISEIVESGDPGHDRRRHEQQTMNCVSMLLMGTSGV